MKVTLIHGKFFNSWEALGLGYIGAYLKRHEPGIDLNFFQGCFDSDDEIVAGSVESDIVAFSCTSPAMKHSLGLARRIKAENRHVRTVFGGYHPSSLPDETAKTEGVDQVVVGEGEGAMLNIVRGQALPIVWGSRMRFRAEWGVPQKWYELDWPDRDLIKSERNIQVAFKDTGKRITSFQAHRGCPFMCRFCADGKAKTMYGLGMEEREVEDLISEIITVHGQYRLDLFKFCDATWNANADWVEKFCRRLQSYNLHWPWFANVHAACVYSGAHTMFESMAAAGCTEIGLGIESGSDRVLKAMGKGITVEKVRRAVALAKDAGIKVRGYFVLGMPEETEEDLRLTEALAEELDLDVYGFTLLCPYPGSALYEAEPKRFKGIDWSLTDEYHNDFWSTPNLTNARLQDWQRRLTEKFQARMCWHSKAVASCPTS